MNKHNNPPYLKLKIINYLGDYGAANFWANIRLEDVERDFEFIRKSSFNAVILVIPYSSFKPNLENFDSRHLQTLQEIFKIAKINELAVIFRLGYLWDTNFQQNRTYERYLDIYKNYNNGTESVYEQDVISFIEFFSNSFETLNCFLSWEDFFWVIFNIVKVHVADDVTCNRIVEHQTVQFMEYLLGKIQNRKNLYIEQRTNGDFEKITYNNDCTYAYFNYHCSQWNWCLAVQDGHIKDHLVPEKNFIEWLSTLDKQFSFIGSKKNKLILNQFNFIDNTYEDDVEFMHFSNNVKDIVKIDIERASPFIRFLSPLINEHLYGIGFWSLWTTIIGHVYNGTFVFGAEGWESDGSVEPTGAKLSQNNFLSTNLGYMRIEAKQAINMLIEYKIEKACQIRIAFNNTEKIVVLDPEKCKEVIVFEGSHHRAFKLECLGEGLTIKRLDFYLMKNKSTLFNEDREPTDLWPDVERMLN